MSTTDSDCTEQKPWRFKPGQSGNPAGRPKGSVGGRQRALQLLDEIIAEEPVITRIGEAMRQAVMDDPLKFFRQIVMPLLPAESKHEITGGGAPWGSLVDMIQQRRALEAKAASREPTV